MSYWRPARRRLNPRCNDTAAWQTAASSLRSEGVFKSVLIAVAFGTLACVILMLRSDIVAFRPGQWIAHDLVARAPFDYVDRDQLAAARRAAALAEPRVFRPRPRVWDDLQDALLALPDRVKGVRLEDLKDDAFGDTTLGAVLDNASLSRLQEYAEQNPRPAWNSGVESFVDALRKLDLVVLDEPTRAQEISLGRPLHLQGIAGVRTASGTLTPQMGDRIYSRIEGPAQDNFTGALWPKVAALAKARLDKPTFELDEQATLQAENAARAAVSADQGIRPYGVDAVIVRGGQPLSEANWLLLRAESVAFRDSLGTRAAWFEFAGLVGWVALITAGLSAYVAIYARRVVQNHVRAVVLAVLLLSALLVAQLSAVGSARLYFAGVAPTLLVAMVLSIAYDRRFALGAAALHATLVTIAVGQGMPFFLVLLAGTTVICFTTDELRHRGRLIEIGGLAGLAMMAAAACAGLVDGNPLEFVLGEALYAGAAGLSVGFLVLGILPFVERAFRITTSMTLLELADTGHPLLRKLAHEAPGTYNHSMSVATLAEEAVAAIGGRSLLARVGAYYHDIGKMNKPEYFIENQPHGSPNRHLTLNPNVSMLIIVGHVKDGVELARNYNLPTALFPFIQSHHGTTLIEYFYWQAVKQEEARSGGEANVPEDQYRYPGPRPRSKECAVLMISDAVESICRTLDEPTSSRIESVIRDVIMKRLTDGQFDECDITMRELGLVERSLNRTLLGIYHARIAYPTNSMPAAIAPVAASRTA